MLEYLPRIVDDDLDELAQGLLAISLEGPKGVGKTATAQRRARTTFALDEPAVRELLAADPGRLDRSPRPVLVGEWQRHPVVWDWVRRSVDRDPGAGRFLLTGGATPVSAPTHSGAGRIVRVRMRPMTLAERGLQTPTVSLRALLSGERSPVDGDTTLVLGASETSLLTGHPAGLAIPRDGTLLGALFESLIALNLRVYAQANEATVHHLRTRNGDHEIDFIIERDDHKIVALEVKLSTTVDDSDVSHLHWLRNYLGSDILDAAVITTGTYTYRRSDGIAVIPAALLAP